MTTTVEVLMEARAELQRRGLHKGDFAPMSRPGIYVNDGNCPICAAGAINVVCGFGVDDASATGVDEAYDALLIGIGRRKSNEPLEDIGNWNDADETTLDVVLAGFDSAIALLAADDIDDIDDRAPSITPGDGEGGK